MSEIHIALEMDPKNFSTSAAKLTSDQAVDENILEIDEENIKLESEVEVENEMLNE